jgi:hypothetical protein
MGVIGGMFPAITASSMALVERVDARWLDRRVSGSASGLAEGTPHPQDARDVRPLHLKFCGLPPRRQLCP